MCVLIIHLQQVPGYPIVVGANRDEFYERPSAPPALDAGGRIMAPTDLRAGGTWVGVNRTGVFAAITNRSRAPLDLRRASRGELCRAALSAPDAESAADRVEEMVQAAPRNGFNLMLADRTRGFVITGDADTERRVLAAGTHILTNWHELDVFAPGEVTPGPTIEITLQRLATACRDHTDHNSYQVCKHHPDRGTVSSALIAIGTDARHPAIFRFADGPPCRTDYRDLGDELAGWPRPEP